MGPYNDQSDIGIEARIAPRGVFKVPECRIRQSRQRRRTRQRLNPDHIPINRHMPAQRVLCGPERVIYSKNEEMVAQRPTKLGIGAGWSRFRQKRHGWSRPRSP